MVGLEKRSCQTTQMLVSFDIGSAHVVEALERVRDAVIVAV
jgi:hypothetical protein